MIELEFSVVPGKRLSGKIIVSSRNLQSRNKQIELSDTSAINF